MSQKCQFTNFSFFSTCSGVNILSCTDSNATSSDSSDPGSPYSHSSTSDDASQQQNKNSNTNQQKMTETITNSNNNSKSSSNSNVNSNNISNSSSNSNASINKNLKRQSLTQTDNKSDKKRAKKDDKNNKSPIEIKLISISPNTATPTPVQPMISTNVTAALSTSSKIANLAKSAFTTLTNISLSTGSNKNETKKTTSSSTNTAPNTAMKITNGMPSLPPGLTLSTDNKITNYYNYKKNPQNFLNSLSQPNSEKKNIEMFCNMVNSQAQLTSTVKSKPKPKVSVTGATTQTVNSLASSIKQAKKSPVEKKTAKIAPIIPVARKTSSVTTQTNQQMKISPKKPVTIAPRIVEQKVQANNAKQITNKSVANVSVSTQNAIKEKSASAPTSTVSSPQHTATPPAQAQPHQPVIYAIHQIPQQPPPLMHKTTTTTTTTTTKLAPFFQLHAPMIPNLIIPQNFMQQFQAQMAQAQAQSEAQSKTAHTATSTATPNLYVSSLAANGSQKQQSQTQQANKAQQLYMNGAVIKLQQIVAPTTTSQQNMSPVTTSSATSIPFTTANHQQSHNKYGISQQQIYAAAQMAQQQMAQQLFMTAPVLLNTASLPTVLTSQIQQHLQNLYTQVSI